MDCGYAEHAVALQFDHVGDNKKMNVSDMIRSDYSWASIKEEIAKCEVRCANCHAVMTKHRKSESLPYHEKPLQGRQSYDEVHDSLAGEDDSADEVWLSLFASFGSLQ